MGDQSSSGKPVKKAFDPVDLGSTMGYQSSSGEPVSSARISVGQPPGSSPAEPASVVDLDTLNMHIRYDGDPGTGPCKITLPIVNKEGISVGGERGAFSPERIKRLLWENSLYRMYLKEYERRNNLQESNFVEWVDAMMTKEKERYLENRNEHDRREADIRIVANLRMMEALEHLGCVPKASGGREIPPFKIRIVYETQDKIVIGKSLLTPENISRGLEATSGRRINTPAGYNSPAMGPPGYASTMGRGSNTPMMRHGGNTPAMGPGYNTPMMGRGCNTPAMGPRGDTPTMRPRNNIPAVAAGEEPALKRLKISI